MTDTVRIRTVYGDVRRVARADLENPRKVLLPMYRENGSRVDDGRFPSAPWCLHRENISVVLP